MKLHTLALISTLALSAATVQPTLADTLYVQPLQGGGLQSAIGSEIVADDFTLAAGGTVTSVAWYGFYGTVEPPGATFTIDFFSNSNGLPGTLLSSNTVGDGSPTGTTDPVVDYYVATLTNPFTTAAGTEYWLEIVSSASYNWFWALGTGGDSLLVINDGVDPPFQATGGDLAFTLSGTPGASTVTPEPSSLILLGTGILGLTAFSRLTFRKPC